MAKEAQVFLCYARPDLDKALAIYERLKESNLRPWLDKKSLKPGDNWQTKIRTAIRGSEFFLVLLTKHSVNKSGYLQKEIKEALDIQDEQADTERYIVPVRLEDCQIPERLSQIQSADLFDADGWSQLLEILSETSEGESTRVTIEGVARTFQLPVGGISTPCFFPSISSAAKNSLSPRDHLNVLVQLKHPLFLISAFDIATKDEGEGKKVVRLLKKAASQGQIVLMDSGLYEKKWRRVDSWPKAKFQHALKQFPFHLAFSFDNPNPSGNASKVAREISNSVKEAQRSSKFSGLIPIVHSQDPKTISAICLRVAQDLDPPMIAVPERELGESIRGCTKRIYEIRRHLDRGLKRYLPIHVLGTGNPLSILAYSWAGADSFDGLDWCQTVADQKTGRLHHSLQLDFFANQSRYASASGMSYMSRVLGHNLDFYGNWMNVIQHHVRENKIEVLMNKYLPNEFWNDARADRAEIEA